MVRKENSLALNICNGAVIVTDVRLSDLEILGDGLNGEAE